MLLFRNEVLRPFAIVAILCRRHCCNCPKKRGALHLWSSGHCCTLAMHRHQAIAICWRNNHLLLLLSCNCSLSHTLHYASQACSDLWLLHNAIHCRSECSLTGAYGVGRSRQPVQSCDTSDITSKKSLEYLQNKFFWNHFRGNITKWLFTRCPIQNTFGWFPFV